MMSTALSLQSNVLTESASPALVYPRAIARLTRLAASAAIRFVVWWAGDLARASRPATRLAWRTRCVRSWARAAVRAAAVRIRVRGVSPSPPFLLVSNHLSYLDIIVMAALVDGRFVARHDIGDWPFIGRLVHAGGTILVQRDRRADAAVASDAMRAAFEEGSGVIFFPEGTSTAGQCVLPFRSSLFEPAVALRQPVHTAALRYTTPNGSSPADESVCWWGDMTFAPHLWKLLQLPSIDAHVAFDETAIAGENRKQLSAAAHASVAALHASITAEFA